MPLLTKTEVAGAPIDEIAVAVVVAVAIAFVVPRVPIESYWPNQSKVVYGLVYGLVGIVLIGLGYGLHMGKWLRIIMSGLGAGFIVSGVLKAIV